LLHCSDQTQFVSILVVTNEFVYVVLRDVIVLSLVVARVVVSSVGTYEFVVPQFHHVVVAPILTHPISTYPINMATITSEMDLYKSNDPSYDSLVVVVVVVAVTRKRLDIRISKKETSETRTSSRTRMKYSVDEFIPTTVLPY
jgi:hypothetical protein